MDNTISNSVNNVSSHYFTNHRQSPINQLNEEKLKKSEKQKLVDILHYNLSFDLFPEEKKFNASATITAKKLTDKLDTVHLNFYDNYVISTVAISGK